MGITATVQCEGLPWKLDFSNPENIDCRAHFEKNIIDLLIILLGKGTITFRVTGARQYSAFFCSTT